MSNRPFASRLAQTGKRLPFYPSDFGQGRDERELRLVLASTCGALVIGAAAGSDFVFGAFWAHHAMLTSLLAGLLVLAVAVVVLNAAIERRDRRRWSLLAQGVLFALVQHARSTWTALIEVLGLAEVTGGSTESLRELSRIALDVPAVDAAARELLVDPERRAGMLRVMRTLADHGAQVIGNWAPVMVDAAPYAAVLDRHVELAGRQQWLTDLLAQKDPTPEQDRRVQTLTRSSVATENADQIDDEVIHSMLLSIVLLATQLDYDSRARAFEIVSQAWWDQRTRAIIESAAGAPSATS